MAFNFNLIQNLIDVQQGRSAQQHHTTQSSPIMKAIPQLNVAIRKDFNKFITCKKTRYYKNRKFARLAISHHQLSKFFHFQLSANDGIAHYPLGFHPLIFHHKGSQCFPFGCIKQTKEKKRVCTYFAHQWAKVEYNPLHYIQLLVTSLYA